MKKDNTHFSDELERFIQFIVMNSEEPEIKKKLKREFSKPFLKKHEEILDQLTLLRESSRHPARNRTKKYLLAIDRLVHQLHSTPFDGPIGDKVKEDVEVKSSVISDIVSSLEEKQQPENSWSKKQQIHFNVFFDVITKWHFCFLSYTTKSEASTYRYKEILDRRKTETNHIVEIAQNIFIHTGGLRNIWFDRERLRPGDPIKPTLRDACEKSLFFIQLVDESSLHQAGTNWQHYEYKKFNNEKRNHYKWLDNLRSNNGVYILRLAKDLSVNEYAPQNTILWQKYCVSNEVLYAVLPYEDGEKFVSTLKEIATKLKEEKRMMMNAVPD